MDDVRVDGERSERWKMAEICSGKNKAQGTRILVGPFRVRDGQGTATAPQKCSRRRNLPICAIQEEIFWT